MDEHSYDIQELISLSGTPRRTIYFYTQQAILPPPVGAGLAARYGDEHLLRLRLVPVLRQKGLRLDQIRAEFGRMDAASMQALLADIPPARVIPLPQPVVGQPAGQAYTRYDLPGGLVLYAPAQLLPADDARLRQILRAACVTPPGLVPMDKAETDRIA
jgi:DNA-binding transcriptional MerR regulator